MHNLYTLRGAEVRDGNLWSRYISEALETFGDKSDVMIAQHHWPVAGQARVVSSLKKQRDMYKFINDQSLRLLNQGYTPAEIAETLRMPASLEQEWSARGYYGTLRHNAKAVYQKYLGWYDANPANLDPLPPVENARKTVEYMGGADGGDRPRARRLRQGRISLGGERDEPGGVRRSRQPRRARTGRRRAGAARLPGRGRRLAQRLSRRREELRNGVPKIPRRSTLTCRHAQGGQQRSCSSTTSACG